MNQKIASELVDMAESLMAADSDLETIAEIVKKHKSLMGIGKPLKEAGFKNVKFYTNDPPLPPAYYEVKVGGKKIVIINKRYADGAEKTVGDIAIGYM